MKKRVFSLIFILLFLLLSACGSGDARAPVPPWEERMTGSCSSAVVFRCDGEESGQTGIDGVTGLPTALFYPEEGKTLALSWRRLGGGEIELMSDYLEGTGTTVGHWEPDRSQPYSAVCYTCPDGGWLELYASCEGMPEAELLRLLEERVGIG